MSRETHIGEKALRYFLFISCMCVGGGEAVHAMVHVESSEDKLPEMFLSFRLAVPGA